MALPWGWYGVVWVFSYPQKMAHLSNYSAINVLAVVTMELEWEAKSTAKVHDFPSYLIGSAIP